MEEKEEPTEKESVVIDSQSEPLIADSHNDDGRIVRTDNDINDEFSDITDFVIAEDLEERNRRTRKISCPCDECEIKEYLGKHMKNVHETERFTSSFCEKKWTSKAQLQEDEAYYKDDFNFGGFRLSCNNCGYQFRWNSDFRVHKQTKHEGRMFACGKCECSTRRESYVNVHKRSKHEDIRYACNQGKFKALHRLHLRVHQKSKDEGLVSM